MKTLGKEYKEQTESQVSKEEKFFSCTDNFIYDYMIDYESFRFHLNSIFVINPVT